MAYKIFFGGTRSDIQKERENAIGELEFVSKGKIELVFFDNNEAHPTPLDADAFRNLVTGCNAAIFAIGRKVGYKYSIHGRPTSFTLEEMLIAQKIPDLSIYLLLNHGLDNKFIASVTDPEERAIWEQIRDIHPTQYVIHFEKTKKGDLTRNVIAALVDYLLEASKKEKQLGKLAKKAYNATIKNISDKDLAYDLSDAESQLRLDLGEEYVDLQSVLALAYAIRKYETRREVTGVAEEWLQQAWLYIVGERTAEETEVLYDKPNELTTIISDWQKNPNIEWFSYIRSYKRNLIIRWLIERGLLYRYTWNFSAEIEILLFAKRLAESVGWSVAKDRDALWNRFYEVYLSALGYARRRDLLNREKVSEILENMKLTGDTAISRKLQLQGLLAAVMETPIKGIPFYENALREYEKNNWRPVNNVTHCYIMITALKSDGKNRSEIAQIKSDMECDFQAKTGQKLTLATDSMFTKVWSRIEAKPRSPFKFMNLWR